MSLWEELSKKRERKMEMSLWEFYEKEIMFFERKTDELFVETMLQEIEIDKRRKKKLKPAKEDIKRLKNLIASSLKAVAIVETYRYFQVLEILPTDQNIQWFYVKREQTFDELLTIFLSKIKRKKENVN